jgi:hypothetical protein
MLLICGADRTESTPVPLKPTTAAPSAAELLLTVNWPASAPAAAGLNFTLNV